MFWCAIEASSKKLSRHEAEAFGLLRYRHDRISVTQAVFVDRDGVLNRSIIREGKPYAPRELHDFRILPGVRCAIANLRTAGFLVVVVTNQPDIGNGLISSSTVERMHEKLRAQIPVDGILICPHRQADGCACRKPKSGMIDEAIIRFGITRAGSYMIGDRNSDILAGLTASLYTIFVDRGYVEPLTAAPHLKVRSLPEAARFILKRDNTGSSQ